MNRTLKNGLVSAFLLLTLLVPMTALAQRTPRVDRREARQQRRINRGVRNGSLTAREARHLERRETKIRRDEAKAKADGTVTARERARLNRELSRDSRHIYRQKHDRRRRY